MLPTSNASSRITGKDSSKSSLPKAVANGRPIRRRHAHMHTSAQLGINIDVAADLEANFAWAPPLAPLTQNIDDDLAGSESISLDEIDAAFALLEHEKEAMERALDDGNEVLEGQVYGFAELKHVDRGLLPKSVDDEIMVVDHTSHDDGQWDVDMLMSSNYVS
ncbi:uncharacterized protein BJ212DRAFT_1309153 [Suillus subaureus]|uniref:Uncharacterized protein n=1 Tax=Suillus subaureus TaxID=48587 RepID=A0A9P7JJU1_9AGAM|nr:uncharacterized protein BJ212DRAFT_1309153 [Suillus subaureus]KAG1826901.1 hypothetical protein BJ212DRAFT_1309153 [Suillus subaureus]